MSERCSERVSGDGPWGSFHMHQCYHPGKVQVDGKWYCAVHDPAYIKKKRDAEQHKYDEKWAKRWIEIQGPALLALVEKMQPLIHDTEIAAEANALIAKCKREEKA